MREVTDHEWLWFRTIFDALCVTKHGVAWEDFVSRAMQSRHGTDFIQVDAAGRGDKGCDGYVDGLMLACYGARRPEARRVTRKIKTDFAKALEHWRDHMTRWAFVYNDADGLSDLAFAALLELKAEHSPAEIRIENWPPPILWKETFRHLNRSDLVELLGTPPSDQPAGLSYIAECVRSLARVQKHRMADEVHPVPAGKIEHNHFGPAVTKLMIETLKDTGHVRYYLSQSSPGEQEFAAWNIRLRYDEHRATYESPDETFLSLHRDLVREAFNGSSLPHVEEQQSAALLVVTHFFETCQIFDQPPEEG